MTDTPAELATRLVRAFGRPDEIVAVLAEDATWWITPALPPEIMPSVTTGREEIRGNMRRVFSILYNAETVTTTIHSAISEGNLGAVRLTMNAQFPKGGNYTNEYCICVEARDGEIANVWEYTDGAYALVQMHAAGIDIQPAGSR